MRLALSRARTCISRGLSLPLHFTFDAHLLRYFLPSILEVEAVSAATLPHSPLHASLVPLWLNCVWVWYLVRSNRAGMASTALRRQVDALRHVSAGTASSYIQRKKGKPSLLLTPDQASRFKLSGFLMCCVVLFLTILFVAGCHTRWCCCTAQFFTQLRCRLYCLLWWKN